jgi:hypothetical protein
MIDVIGARQVRYMNVYSTAKLNSWLLVYATHSIDWLSDDCCRGHCERESPGLTLLQILKFLCENRQRWSLVYSVDFSFRYALSIDSQSELKRKTKVVNKPFDFGLLFSSRFEKSEVSHHQRERERRSVQPTRKVKFAK